MPVSKTPKVVLWNAQGIVNKSKQQQINFWLNNDNIDILLIVETFLKPTHTFILDNYTLHRNDRLRQAHGGVAIAIRNSISHKLISALNTHIIENIAIELPINNVPTVICVAYCPKSSTHFASDLQLLTSTSSQYMLFGDFNAKHVTWNCNVNNKSGNTLFSLQQSNRFMVFNPPTHTHFPHSGQTPSTIDILISDVNFAFELTTHSDNMGSDHVPVICSINGNINHSQKPIYNYSNADWSKFRRLIEANISTLSIPTTAGEADRAIDAFNAIISNAKSQCIPIKSCHSFQKLSSETQNLIRRKNTIKRRWQRAQSVSDKLNLKQELNQLQRAVNKSVNAEYNTQWANRLRRISKGDKKLWDLAKKCRGKKDCSVNKIEISNSPFTDDTARANCLASIFEKSHNITANFTHRNDTIVAATINSFNAFSNLNCNAPVIETAEILNHIKSLKPFKSPGTDGIQNILIKNLPMKAIEWLTKTFNVCIKISHWPSSFKLAKVIPILKSGKAPQNPESYRPISLLSAVGKVFEKVVQLRLIHFIEDKNLLPDFQFGFRQGHSTIHQAMRLKKYIISNKINKKSTGLILLDIEKAFDSIWHDGLIFKLIKMKLPTYLIRLINSFIRNRRFAVYVNDSVSNTIHIPAGLAQGTCISPILYALFVADFPQQANVQLALYADDTGMYTAAKTTNAIIRRLNSALNTVRDYFIKWKIKINDTKTQGIIFPFDNKRRRTPSIQMKCGDNPIVISDTVNYLGITFDKKLSFKSHVANSITKSNKCYRALYPLLAIKSHLSTENKTTIYTAVIRAIMTYGSPVWSSAAMCHKLKLLTLQNKIIKTINKLHFRTPSALLERLTNIKPLNAFINELNQNFLAKCSSSNYALIREIDVL